MLSGRKLTILPLSYVDDDNLYTVGRGILEAHPNFSTCEVLPARIIPGKCFFRETREDRIPCLDQLTFEEWLILNAGAGDRDYTLIITSCGVRDPKNNDYVWGRAMEGIPISYITTHDIDPRSTQKACISLGLHELGHHFGLRHHEVPVRTNNGYCPMMNDHNPDEYDVKYCGDCLKLLKGNNSEMDLSFSLN